MPGMTSRDFTEALHGLARAWADKDYDRAAAFFAPDVRYIDPLRYAFDSRDALLAFFQDDDAQEQRTTWHVIVFDEARQAGAAEYTYEGTHRYHGVVIIDVADELFHRWREYQHISSLDRRAFFGGVVD